MRSSIKEVCLMEIADATTALSWPLNYASYSPAELERISGLSTDMQRVWRRRGHLPPVASGHARFDPAQVIEISIRFALSKLGVSPTESRVIDEGAIAGALYHALLGHHGSCEVIGPPAEVDAFLDVYEDRDLAFSLAGYPEASNYLIWDDEDGVRIVDDPQGVFDQRTISTIAIDLTVVGAQMMERGRKPIVTLEASPERGVHRVRRLTGIGANDS
jgi:hypothetical protein